MKDSGATAPTLNNTKPAISRGSNSLNGCLATETWSTVAAGAAVGLDGAADNVGGGGGQVILPSLITVVPRITSSSILTLITPSFEGHNSVSR